MIVHYVIVHEFYMDQCSLNLSAGNAQLDIGVTKDR